MSWIGAALTFALATRAGWLFVRYMLGFPGAQRFQVESAVLLFVSIGLILKWARSHRDRTKFDAAAASPVHSWAPGWAAFSLAALALYWPALGIGPLSDDFLLIEHARRWDVGPVHAALFRPIPLTVWSALLSLGGGASLLHLLNILLHGTNAYLARVLIRSRAAGLLVLAGPLAVEAVAWLSGVFDVMATTFVLLAVLTARRYTHAAHAPARTRTTFILLGVAALLSKEWAAVAGVLVLADAWARMSVRSWPRPFVVDAAALIAIAGAFSIWRLMAASGDLAAVTLDQYTLQRALFLVFGSLAVPWHQDDVVVPSLWMSIVFGLSVLVLVLGFLLRRGRRAVIRQTAARLTWMLAPIVPAFPFFFVAGDLQGARYLYLPAIGWAALIVHCVPGRGRIVRGSTRLLLAVLISLSAYGTVRHLRPWSDAAALRDRVLAAAERLPIQRCTAAVVAGLPDHVRGAYVFRNGAPEALARTLGTGVTVGDGAGPCAFRWDPVSGSFVPRDAP